MSLQTIYPYDSAGYRAICVCGWICTDLHPNERQANACREEHSAAVHNGPR